QGGEQKVAARRFGGSRPRRKCCAEIEQTFEPRSVAGGKTGERRDATLLFSRRALALVALLETPADRRDRRRRHQPTDLAGDRRERLPPRAAPETRGQGDGQD